MFGLIVCLVIVSAAFSAAETAYGAVSITRLRLRSEAGDMGARRALALAEEFDKLLSTILVGNNVANILLSSVTAVYFASLLGEQGVAIATALVTVIVILFGEITPKTLAKRKPESVAIALARPLALLKTALKPICWAVGKWQSLFGAPKEDVMSSEEIAAEVEAALPQDDAEIVKDTLEFVQKRVQDIFVYRAYVVSVDISDSAEIVMSQFAASGHSRLVVQDGDFDHIVGYIHFKAFVLRGDRDWREVIVKALFVPQSMLVDSLLRDMQQTHKQLAIVVDEFGGTDGIVALEDVLEEIVGEITDEHESLA